MSLFLVIFVCKWLDEKEWEPLYPKLGVQII